MNPSLCGWSWMNPHRRSHRQRTYSRRRRIYDVCGQHPLQHADVVFQFDSAGWTTAQIAPSDDVAAWSAFTKIADDLRAELVGLLL
jgi:hypothetical protein